ncbi:MAG: D-alanine--D-alanine ligase family protein [Ruminococcus sp.]|jgi:D-alanine-D-alanine ligase
MKIVVLAGGISTEREVSIVSGSMVCRALREKGHDAILLDVFFGKKEITPEEAFSSEYSLEEEIAYIKSFNAQAEEARKGKRDFFGPNVIALCKRADVVFLALHGENGENGKVQAAFDLLHIKYTGTGHLSSAMAMDKGLTKKLLQAAGVPVPAGKVIKKDQKRKTAEELGLTLPVVVKPCCGGSSVGVFIVHTESEYEKALEEAFGYEDEVVVEAYISGREFSVGVVDDQVYPVIEIAPLEGFYDYKNKYTAGSTVETCPAEITAEETKRMQEYADRANRALMVEGYARWDFLMDHEGNIYCLEGNTLPGMTPTSLLPQEAGVLGITFPQLCELLVKVSMKKYES